MDKRLENLHHWLSKTLGYNIDSLMPASADASFRRYFRMVSDSGTFVVMDAPPDKENSQAFVDIAIALSKLGIHTPQIINQDLAQGFIVLEDLGQRTYQEEVREAPNQLYSQAIDSLIQIQKGNEVLTGYTPPNYSVDKLYEEMSLFSRWFVSKHLGEAIHEPSFAVWLHTQQYLAKNCLEQPQVWVHRDYHSRNLMVCESNTPGVIDFQDLVIGPLTYDLASIFKDCYIEWPRVHQQQWLEEYRVKAIEQLNLPDISLATLSRWVDLTGLQRHLKVLGIFCRLSYRDNKHNYLADLPLVAKYVLEVLDIYPELKPFKDHFEGHIGSVI